MSNAKHYWYAPSWFLETKQSREIFILKFPSTRRPCSMHTHTPLPYCRALQPFRSSNICSLSTAPGYLCRGWLGLCSSQPCPAVWAPGKAARTRCAGIHQPHLPIWDTYQCVQQLAAGPCSDFELEARLIRMDIFYRRGITLRDCLEMDLCRNQFEIFNFLMLSLNKTCPNFLKISPKLNPGTSTETKAVTRLEL